MTTALVVLSGGQDSTTCLFHALHRYPVVHAISFDYNQRHSIELEAAQQVVKFANLFQATGKVTSHEIVSVGPILKGMSPLTNQSKELETYANHQEMERIIGDRRELTFVPMRNPLFLTVAANRAEVLGARALVTGVCQADNANYSDCRQTFIDAYQSMLNLALGLEGQKDRIEIDAPLMFMSKAESIGYALTMPGCYAALGFSHTAYAGTYPPTSQDHASVLRAHGFEQAGVPDPLVVRAWFEKKMDLPGTKNYTRHLSFLQDCNMRLKKKPGWSQLFAMLIALETHLH